MADQSSFFSTPKLHLPYIGEVGQQVTPDIERQRFVTIDVQLDALFSILGNGIISGWNITTTPPANPDGTIPASTPMTIYVTAGKGHINSLAAETNITTTITSLANGTSTYPGINYIYVTTNDNTPETKETIFVTSNYILNQDNMVLLGLVTVIDSSISIDTSGRIEIGFLSVLLTSLAAHKHGKDGITAIDLASEVKGFLDSLHIGDIPAERITSGIIDPARFFLEHASLLNSGTLPHSDLDSVVEILQKSNRRLFGDISTSNLMQLVIATKKALTNVDKYFRNLIIIIPGLSNNTFLNELSFLDPESAIDKNLYDADPTISQYTNPATGELIVFRSDAAIVDFNNSEIMGVLSGGTSVHDRNIDTLAEFEDSRYDEDYVSVSGMDETAEDYIYGYGRGYGYGLDYFDVFGIASGLTDTYGNDLHRGYGTEDFEIAYANQYGYGYGYEYIPGGGELPGHVNVTLVRGVTDEILDATIDYPEDFTEDSAKAALANTEDDDIYNQFLERFIYHIPDSTQGSAEIAYFQNPRLVYNFDYTNDDESEKWDWTYYDSLTIQFKTTAQGAPETYTFDQTWYFKAYSEITVDGEAEEVESDEIPIIGMATDDILNLDPSSASFDNTIAIDISTILPVTFDKSKVTKFKLYIHSDDDNYTRYIEEDDTKAIPWDSYINNLSIGGTLLYATNDDHNKLDQLYVVIPSVPAAKLENILWLVDEPSDSRVLIYVKTVDINTDTSGLDGFTLLANMGDSGFGAAYTNKSRTGSPARPSGSAMTEANATHLELKIVLQPSTDGLFAPTLHSITIRYSTVGSDEIIVFDDEEDFNIQDDSTAQRVNLDITINSELIINNDTDIKSRRYGATGKFQELVLTNGIYVPKTHVDNKGLNLPKTIQQYMDSSLNLGYNYVAAVKRNSEQHLIIADTTNHRIVMIDEITNAMLWGLYGTFAYTDTSVLSELSPIFAHYNEDNTTLYVGFSHVVNSNINIAKWYIVDSDSYITLNNAPASQDGDTISIINANGVGQSVSGGTVAIKFGNRTLSRYSSLSGALSLSIDSSTVTSSATTEKNEEAFSSIPLEKYIIYYGEISNPIDVKIDSEDNLIIAQALDSDSAKNAQAIFKIAQDDPSTYIYNFNAASDGKAFSFDPIYYGSVEEILDDSGNIEILVADVNNQRVIRFDQTGGTILWQLSTDNTGGKAYIPSNLYPSCATRGSNEKIYVTLLEKTTGKNSRVIEVTNDFKLTKTILSGVVTNPKDVYYIESESKLLIST